MGLLVVLVILVLPVLLAASLYVLLVKTQAVTNGLVALLGALLQRQGFCAQSDCYSLDPCPGGILLRNILVPATLLKLTTASVSIPYAHVKVLQLLWPTFVAPLTLRVSGVTVKVLQRRTAPKVQATGHRAKHDTNKLRALEALLWTGQQPGSSARWRSFQQQLLRFVIALALRNISVSVTDVGFQYLQSGDPAPVLIGGEDTVVDGVAVAIRTIEMSPVAHSVCPEAGMRTHTAAVRRSRRKGTGAPTGPPCGVQRQLNRWLRLGAAAPKLEAFRDWLVQRLQTQSRMQYCNASQISVAGVDVVLISRSPEAMQKQTVDKHQPPPSAGQCPYRFGLRRRRVRAVAPAEAATAAAGMSPGRGEAPGGRAGGTLLEPHWDLQSVILRQWSAQIDVSLAAQSKGSGESGVQSNGAAGRSMALHIQGALGVSSAQRKQQQAAQQPCPGESGASSSARQEGVHAAAAPGPSKPASEPQPADGVRGSKQRAAPAGSQSAVSPGPAEGRNGRGCSVGSVDVTISLKALLLELTPEATVQILRIVDRVATYQKYSKYWRLRPDVSVSQSPAAWWQHAGRAVVNECRAHCPVRNTDQSMARRAEYIRTYKALRSLQRGFRFRTSVPQYENIDRGIPKPERLPLPTKEKIYPRRKCGPTGAQALRFKLAQLESLLTLGEVMCWRTFVALQHSAYLAKTPAAEERWLGAMGVITTFYDAIPTMDEEEEEEGPDGLGGEVVADRGDGSKRSAAHSAISLSVACPRLGLKLVNKCVSPVVSATAEPPGAAAPAETADAQKPRREADVLALILEDIRFAMPSMHHLALQAATIRASQYQGATNGAVRNALVVPASPESMEAYGTKLDFSPAAENDGPARAGSGRGTGTLKSPASPGSVYPDAPISSYLSRFKVTLAPVEIAFVNLPFILATTRYLMRMAELKALTRKAAVSGSAAQAGTPWPSSSLRSLVLDSYTRNRVPLPSLMASFKPKLQFYCPMITARWRLAPDYTPTVGGVSEQHSEVVVVAVLTDIRLSSRYIHTCYTSLLQCMTAQAHAELYFQMLPRVDKGPAAPGGQTAATSPGVPGGEPLQPERGPFCKIWLHPDDVTVAFPSDGHARSVDLHSRVSHMGMPSAASRQGGASFRGSTCGKGPESQPPTSYPFLPLVKIRSLSAKAMSQVPYEPAVPGTMTAHQTLGVHSILLWFSSWQAKFVLAFIDQFRSHPVLNLLRALRGDLAKKNEDAASCRGEAVSANATGSAGGGGEAGTAARAGGGSSISMLLDVPLLAVNCYVELPKTASSCSGGAGSTRQPGAALQAAAWVKQAADAFGAMPAADLASHGVQHQQRQQQPGELPVAADLVLRWGLSIAPLLTLNVANLRAGLRLTKGNELHAALQMAGLQISDHQARLKRRIYQGVWRANAGKPSGGLGATAGDDLPPESISDQVLGPMATRAEALRRYARYRRRAALSLGLHLVPPEDRHGQARQIWRRLLEVRQLNRASDFAMFLLSKTHQRTAHIVRYAALRPIDCYSILFKAYRSAEDDKAVKTRLLGAGNSADSQHSFGGSPSGPVDKHPPSPFQSTAAGSGLPSSGLLRPRHGSEHVRSLSTASGPSVGRSRPRAAPHRKTISMVQALTSVSNGDTAGMMAIWRSAMNASTMQRLGLGNATGGLGPEALSVTSSTMRCIPEDSLMPSSTDGTNISTPCYSLRSLGATGSVGPDRLQHNRSSTLRHTVSNTGVLFAASPGTDAEESSLQADGDPAETQPSMQSAFSAADVESRAAASGAMPGPGYRAGCQFAQEPSLPPCDVALVAAAKLCFVQAFQHLRICTGAQQWSLVQNMPLMSPFVTALLSREPGAAGAGPTQHVHARCRPLQGCIGAHSVGAMLHFLVQVQQAVGGMKAAPGRAPQAGATPASSGSPSSGAPRRLHVGLELYHFDVKVVMEEKPRRVLAAAPPRAGLTEITSVQLRQVVLTAKLPEEPLKVEISDVQLLDLQGCVEHRNVLVANRHTQAAESGSESSSQRCHATTGRGQRDRCRVEVVLEGSPGVGVPGVVKVAVRSPCVTWLRRYTNNLAYAVGVVRKAYADAVQVHGHGLPRRQPPAGSAPAPAGSQPAGPIAGDSASGLERPTRLPTVISVQVENLGVVLPGGAAAKKGPIRRSVRNDALFIEVDDMSVCLPGSLAALRQLAVPDGINDPDGTADAHHWVPTEAFVKHLVSSCLRLTEEHFPVLSQSAPSEDGPTRSPGTSNPGSQTVQWQSPSAVTGVARQPAKGRLQKGLRAAKTNLLDPIKEILHEAGQKSNKRHGEAGLLIIDEGPVRGPADQLSGYLTIPENDERALNSAAAMQHTTVTFTADASPAAAPVGPDPSATARQVLQSGGATAPPQHAGACTGAAFHGEDNSSGSTTATSSADASICPIVAFSAKGLAAYSCVLVPHDKRCHDGHAHEQSADNTLPVLEQDTQPGPKPSQAHGSKACGAAHPAVLELRLLADTERQSLQCLIDPVRLDGTVFTQPQHGSVQLHLSAPEAMNAMLGPYRYDRMIKVLTDNIVEAYSCFNVGFPPSPNKAQWNTSFSPNAGFGPRPGQHPYFQLTIQWEDQLLAALESDPSWWRPDCQPGLCVEPCLQGCFTRCSFGLIMMRQTNDMHLAFHSQELHVADVRVSALLQPAVGSAACSEFHYQGGAVPQPTESSAPGDLHTESYAEDAFGEDEEEPVGELGGALQENDDTITDASVGPEVHPVVDSQPSAEFPGAPAVVTLLRSSIDLPTDEAAHLRNVGATEGAGVSDPECGRCPHDIAHSCVRISFSMLRDGTMANEIELCHTLVQWPYLTEMSLVSAIISIFLVNWGRPATGPEVGLRVDAFPWFYFNIVLRDSQLFVPVLAPHLRRFQQAWYPQRHSSNRHAVGDEERNRLLTSKKLQELFATMVAADSFGGHVDRYMPDDSRRSISPTQLEWGFSGHYDVLVDSARHSRLRAPHGRAFEEPAPRLELTGVVLTTSALRFGYFAGGDGESIIKVDLRNTAGCARHSGAQVTNWLLPVRSMSLDYRCSMPTVEESRLLQCYIFVARNLVFRLRTRSRTPAGAQEQTPNQQSSGLPSRQPSGHLLADAVPQQQQRPAASGVGVEGRSTAGAGEDLLSIHSRMTRGDASKPPLDLLVEQATARAVELLEKHKISLPTSAATRVTMEKLLSRRPAVITITFCSDRIAVRGAFSNIPLLHALTEDLGLASELLQYNKGIFAPAPAVRRALMKPVLNPGTSTSSRGSAAETRASWNFRRSTMSAEVNVQSLAFVLCDDKPKSYGAPDVLTVSTEQLSVQYCTDKRYVDHLPEQSGCVSFRLSAQFLNNSTGRWEHLLEPWPAEFHLFDPINPIFKSSRTKFFFVSSSEVLKLSFHPSCLLTIGDALAFVRRLSNPREGATAAASRRQSGVAAPKAEKPPSVPEQMALGGSVLSRVPQRYLIQNMTGMLLSYWAPLPEDGRPQTVSKKRWLPSGFSEELQVDPTLKQVKLVGPGGVVVTRMHAQVIVLKFEGNWMPLPDVSVDVVGKYCYDLRSPTEDLRAPVVVDVVLVGRTKILKIHSALYVQNSTTLRIGFRLHFPTAMLARQVAVAPGDKRLPGEQDMRLRPLCPGEGRYLPVLAALGGTLYLEPRLHVPRIGRAGIAPPGCAYHPPEHDVIRLFPAVTDMPAQSGFIASGPPYEPEKGLYGSSPLHFAVKVKVKSRSEYSYAAFHSIEVPGPGLFAKATRPLEASIKIAPTLSVTNALPFYIDGYVITSKRATKEPQLGGSSNAYGGPAAVASGSLPTLEARASRIGPLMVPTIEAKREAAGNGEKEGAKEHQRVLDDFSAVAQILKHKPPDWRLMEPMEQKLHALALLRYELRCVVKDNPKELELLNRCEDREQAEKVTWQELGTFVEWAKHNVRRVQILPGGTQHHYVDMRKHAMFGVKVPHLQFISTGPVAVNYGESGTGREVEQLPEVVVLRKTDNSESYERVRSLFLRPKNQPDAHKSPIQDMIEGLQTVQHGIQHAVQKTAAVVNWANLTQANSSANATSPTTSATFWQQEPDKLVRVQLLVETSPAPRVGANDGQARLQQPAQSPAAAGGSAGGMLSPFLSPSAEPGGGITMDEARDVDASPSSHTLSPGRSLLTWFSKTRSHKPRAVRFVEGEASALSATMPASATALEQAGTTERRLVPELTMSQVVEEQHVRLRLSYRPPCEEPQHGASASVLQHVSTYLERMVPASFCRGPDGLSLASGRPRFPSRGIGRRASSEPFVRVRLSVLPSSVDAPERVQLRLAFEAPVQQRAPSVARAILPAIQRRWQLRKVSMEFKKSSLPSELSRVPGFVRRGTFQAMIPEEDSEDQAASGLTAVNPRLATISADAAAHADEAQLLRADAGGRHTTTTYTPLLGASGTAMDADTSGRPTHRGVTLQPTSTATSCSGSSAPLPFVDAAGGGTFARPSLPWDRSPAALAVASSPRTPRAGGVVEYPPPDVSTGATSPQTVVVRSGSVSPISVPSASPPGRYSRRVARRLLGEEMDVHLPTGRSPSSSGIDGLAGDGAAEATSSGTHASGTDVPLRALPQSDSPPTGNNAGVRRSRPVWTENAAYLQGSTGSTFSASELPVRKSPSDFNVRVATHGSQPQPSGVGSGLQEAATTRWPPAAQQLTALDDAAFDRIQGRRSHVRTSRRASALTGRSASSILKHGDGGADGGSKPGGLDLLWRKHGHSLRTASAQFSARVPPFTKTSVHSDSDMGRRLATADWQGYHGSRSSVRSKLQAPPPPHLRGEIEPHGDLDAGAAASSFGRPSEDRAAPVRASGRWPASFNRGYGLPRRAASGLRRAHSAFLTLVTKPHPLRGLQANSPDEPDESLASPRGSPARRPFSWKALRPGDKQLSPSRDSSPRSASSPYALAKTAVHAVQRLPSMARNVGGKIVDGGQQVAAELASTIIAGGQGVKASTEQAYHAAKPKIKRGIGELMWQMTECMRKRKAGDAKSKSVDGVRKKLNLHNSLATKEDDFVCRLTLSSPFWLDNRTGFDLMFKEQDVYRFADNLPFLPFNTVRAPGHMSDATALDTVGDLANRGTEGTSATPSAALRSMTGPSGGVRLPFHLRPASHTPVLLNDQRRARFRVDDGRFSKTEFSTAFAVDNATQKFPVEVMAAKSKLPLDTFEALMAGATSVREAKRSSGGMSSSREPTPGGPEHDGQAAGRFLQLLQLPRMPSVSSQHAVGLRSASANPSTRQRSRMPLSSLEDIEASPLSVAGADVSPSKVQRFKDAQGLPEASVGAEACATRSLEDCQGSVAGADAALSTAFGSLEVTSLVNSSTGDAAAAAAGAEGSVLALPNGLLGLDAGAGQSALDVVGPQLSLRRSSLRRTAPSRTPEITPIEEGSEYGQSPMAAGAIPAAAHLEGVPGMREKAAGPYGAAYRVGDGPSFGVAMASGSTQEYGMATPSGRSTVAIALRAATSSELRVGFSSLALTAEADTPKDGPVHPEQPSASGKRRTGSNWDALRLYQRKPKMVCIRRLYQFVVEVWPAPNSTVFNHTKVITVKNKYYILNATGLTIEYKQKGTPDPVEVVQFGQGHRFSGRLEDGWRAAWHWDNAHAEQELMIRPAGEDWEWSGSFKLPEVEDYFGLRIRRRKHGDYVIIPVNISVGAAGSVLVTLKSKESVPPYMIINRCQDVAIRLKQADWAGRGSAKASQCLDGDWGDWDEIPPNGNVSMPFAWDEPRLKHVVKVVAKAQRDSFPGHPAAASAIDVDLDAVDANTVIYVQSRAVQPHIMPLQSAADRQEKAKLLSDNAKKVYVTVYADGPTRVLCFAEDRTGVAYMDDENSLLNLSYRLQQVAVSLKKVEHRLTQQFGGSPGQDRRPQGPSGDQTVLGAGAYGSSDHPDPDSRTLELAHGPGGSFGAFAGGSVTAQVSHWRGAAIGSTTIRRTMGAQRGIPPSGPATPPSLRQGVPSSVGAGGSFAFQRATSAGLGHRYGSQYALAGMQQPYTRVPSLPAATVAPQLTASHHGRLDSNPGGPAPQAATTGLPPLLAAAPMAVDNNFVTLLEALPAYGNDVDVPIGGDLTLTFFSVEGLTAVLSSNEKLLAVEAKMVINSSDNKKRSNATVTASWNQVGDGTGSITASTAPFGGGSTSYPSGRIDLRRHEEVFRDIPASAELQIDFYIAKGTESTHIGLYTAGAQGPSHASMHLPHIGSMGHGYGYQGVPVSATATGTANQAGRPQMEVTGGQFAGCVRVPLLLTLGRLKDQEWRLPLERKTGSQQVRGHVVMSFEWSVTNEGMLIREVAALERILAEKVELLAMLNPLPTSATAHFVYASGAEPSRARLAIPWSPASAANEPYGDTRSLSLGSGGNMAPPVRSSPPGKRTAKAMAESYFVNLELSVLEVAGLLPREGLRASMAASMYGKQTASLVSTAMLPRAVVSMTVGSESRNAAAGVHSVNPRFPKNTCTFTNIPLGAKVRLQVLDQVSNTYYTTLAEAELHVADIRDTDPIYAWLALPRRSRSKSQRMLALLMVMEEEGDADVQVLMRIKIHKPELRGMMAAVNLDLAGVALCAKTNIEELFNFTMQKIRASLVQTRMELQTAFTVQAIQFDNQMLEANNPVVLSVADGSRSGSVGHARRRHVARLERRAKGANPILRLGRPDSTLREPLLSIEVTYNQASSNLAATRGSTRGHRDNMGIMSFKKVVVDLGPLDFSADQEFIEGVIAYMNAMPLADLHQDEAWQQRIDSMQSGAGEPLGGQEEPRTYTIGRRERSAEVAYKWLLDKETAEMEMLRGQSSMWFYLEEFYLSDVFINVTLALSSNFGAGGMLKSPTASNREEDRQRSMLRGFLSRVSGSNGFQLINVTNVPIQLDAMELQNHLVNRVSLVNKLQRHYQWMAVVQARKVLGGAGPAIAQIPASVLWAGIALVDLAQDVAAKRVNPLLVPTRMGYVTFTFLGQVIGVLSRTMCAMMAVLPPRFSTDTYYLTDPEAARRFGVKPLTVMDALFLAHRDVMLGMMSAAFGVVHDTAAGGRWQGPLVALGIPMGLSKAALGLAVRPTAGAVEATSKFLQGVGLLCLGKRGIQGKLVRRVQAPGVAITDVVQAARASAALEVLQAEMVAAWQASLPSISSALADDEVLDVVAARPTRVVLLTNQHLVYIYARRHAAPSSSYDTSGATGSGGAAAAARAGGAFSVSYRVKWMIRNDHIDNIRGLERGYCVSVDYHKPVKLGRLSLKLPLHRGMRTATAEGHKDLIFRLNRHLGHSTGSASTRRFSGLLVAAPDGRVDGGGDVADLRITSYSAGLSGTGMGGGLVFAGQQQQQAPAAVGAATC